MKSIHFWFGRERTNTKSKHTNLSRIQPKHCHHCFVSHCHPAAVCLLSLISPCADWFFPVLSVRLFSTCQRRKDNFRSFFFLSCDKDITGLFYKWTFWQKAMPIVSKDPLYALIGMLKETIQKGNEASKLWFYRVCNFLVFDIVNIVALAYVRRGWVLVSLEYFWLIVLTVRGSRRKKKKKKPELSLWAKSAPYPEASVSPV